MKNILVIAAHPDDEILGVGGTVKKLSKDYNVYALILGEGMTSRYDDQSNKSMVEELHGDTLAACNCVGYKKVFFENLPDNRFDSVDNIEVTKIIEKYVDELQPLKIFTHHYGDLNIDHRITCNAVQTATRTMADCLVQEIYLFETPSSTEWNYISGHNAFRPNVFIDISNEINDKLEAMRQYKTELREYPHPRSIEALEIIAKRWGINVGKRYVEAFELLRMVL